MSKQKLIEQLDKAVEEIMTDRGANQDEAMRSLDPRIIPLLRIAAELRNLPSPGFKARLKTRLGSVLAAEGLPAGPAEFSKEMPLAPHSVAAALQSLPFGKIKYLAPLDEYMIGVSRLSTQSPEWERYSTGDKLLHVLDGELDVTTLSTTGPVHTTVKAGSVF
ncbi:MAG TPA: hypothetical protein VJX67_03795, partial [Blastocatellia bacterium]|nr:hypothetical protein [Blastocatellia bacterium]